MNDTIITPDTSIRPGLDLRLTSALKWLGASVALSAVPLLGAAVVVPVEILGFREDYPELATVLTVYAIIFAVAGAVAIVTALVTAFALHSRAKQRNVHRPVTIAALLTGFLTLMMGGLLVSAFFVPAGGPLFAPILLFLTLVGGALTMSLHRWGQAADN